MKDFITFEEITEAYFSCRKHKRNKASAIQYELNYEENNYKLWRELNEGTYQISQSICFCVTKPKLREVFAASFRDRIVHHLLINKFLSLFESKFITDTYSCRVGKGVLYGVKRIQEKINKIGKDCWFLKLDLSSFFTSIDRNILWTKCKWLIVHEYKGDNLEKWLNLFKLIIFNRPEQNCFIKGNPNLLKHLPKTKSLFYSNGKGLPIGNLTSQIFANYYLSKFDNNQTLEYGRYVDDFIFLSSNKKDLIDLLKHIRDDLGKLGLQLNEEKTIIQRADKGVLFIGYIIKPWGIYPGNRLKRNIIKLSKINEDLEIHLIRLNSYLGFLKTTLSYNIKYKVWQNTKLRYFGIYGKAHLNSIHKWKVIKQVV